VESTKGKGSQHPASRNVRASPPAGGLGVTKASTRPVWHHYLRALGPGLVTGASDDDPSGIATYSQAGAQFGLAFLWTALLTWPLMVGVQEICDRTALATGTSLGGLALQRFHRAGRAIVGVLLVALLVANALTVPAIGTLERFPAAATLTLHGVRQPVHFTASVERVGSSVYVLADISLPFAGWNISIQGVPWLADIQSPGTIEVLLDLTQGAGNPAAVTAPATASGNATP
jgi:hypothetical protein